MNWLLVGVAVLAGLSNPVQSAANAGMHKALGQILPAALMIYAVALVTLAVASPFLGIHLRDLPAKAVAAPWWVWVGGVCNVIFVLAGAAVTQKIGSGVFTVTVACSAIILSLLLDKFGLLGLHPHPLSILRILGGAMAVGGIALVSLS